MKFFPMFSINLTTPRVPEGALVSSSRVTVRGGDRRWGVGAGVGGFLTDAAIRPCPRGRGGGVSLQREKGAVGWKKRLLADHSIHRFRKPSLGKEVDKKPAAGWPTASWWAGPLPPPFEAEGGSRGECPRPEEEPMPPTTKQATRGICGLVNDPLSPRELCWWENEAKKGLLSSSPENPHGLRVRGWREGVRLKSF